MATVMRASPAQRNRVGIEEGNRLIAYQDTVGIWTIGKGHAATNPIPVRGMLNGEFYQGPPKKGVIISAHEVDRLFELDMDETERGISALIDERTQLTQNQFDALCDFVHQYGLGRLRDSTLLVKLNFNPNAPAVLDELMRWTRAGGEHAEYVWRRSCRRCCIYVGNPIPQKLWRKASTEEEPTDGYPFVLTEDGKHIDYAKTPPLGEIMSDGKKAATPPKFDPSKPLPNVTIITDVPKDDALVLDQPASPIPVGDKGDGASPASQPASAPAAPSKTQEPAKPTVASPAVPGSVGPAAPVSTAPPPQAQPVPVPKPTPPVIAGQDGTKPPSPWTKQVNEVDYKLDPNAGLKPIEDSDRGRAFFWQRLSKGFIYVGCSGTFGSGMKGVSDTLANSAPLMNIALDLAVPALVSLHAFAAGLVMKSYGDWARKRANERASQGLY